MVILSVYPEWYGGSDIRNQSESQPSRISPVPPPSLCFRRLVQHSSSMRKSKSFWLARSFLGTNYLGFMWDIFCSNMMLGSSVFCSTSVNIKRGSYFRNMRSPRVILIDVNRSLGETPRPR